MAATTHPDRSEIKLVVLISLLAALHVFVFTAAFPFFNSVDEPLHFDLVVRYSQGQVPRQLDPITPEALRYVALFSSLAYLATDAQYPGGKLPPPPWTQPVEKVIPQMLGRERDWGIYTNTETGQPPLYYSVAGAWWLTGSLAGMDGECLLYWLRFLNLLIVIGVAWLGWLAARKIFPENIFVRLAVPALVAFMPQTAFYSINSDIAMPLVFGGAFLLLLKFWEAEIPAVRPAAATGLLLGATFLTKLNSLPLLAAAGFIAVKMFRLHRGGKLHSSLPALAAMSVCALLPMLAWMAWCHTIFGDLTGSAAKIHMLGWTNRPVTEWLHHPLFSLHGLWVFLGDTFATFWQGEFLWRRQPLALPVLDWFYKVLTLGLLALALVAVWKRRASEQRARLIFAFGCLAATLVFFALLSVKYDFQDCFYPSRAHPFFTSGRLYLGGLVPILILLASSLDFALQKISLKSKFILLAALLLFMLAGETAVDWRVFPCEFNWYHL